MKRTKILANFSAALLILFSMLCQTITASAAPDTQSPTTPTELTVFNRTYTTISLSWTGSSDDTKVKGYQIFRDDKKVASTSDTYYECKKLTPGTSYTFYIKAYDKAGNYSTQSNRVSANTILDKTAPSPPSGLKASSVTVTEVNLTWSPSLDNVKVKGYDILRDGIKVGTTSKASYLNKSLIPGKSYTYTVRASDISGNLSGNSSQLKITTSKDLQAPAAPADLIVSSVNGSSVSLKWTTSTDNAKVVGYQIYCNGIVIANAVRTSRIVKSPFGLGLDVYWIKAYDQAGNVSGSSNTVTAITFP